MQAKQRYKLTFTPLSPIHIGTGDEIDPLEYVMEQPQGEYPQLYRINLPKVVESLNEEQRSKFLALLDKKTDDGNVQEIRNFIRRVVAVKKHSFYTVPAEEDLYKLWRKNSEKALIVNPVMRRLDTWCAIIPGSSIKGAIRTAILSPRVNKEPNGQGFGWENEFLQASNPYDDPFRALQIEDLTLLSNAVQIYDVKMLHKNPLNTEQTSKIQQFYEMTFCVLQDNEGDDPTRGVGGLSICTGLQREQLKLKLSIDEINKQCRAFYIPKAKAEHKGFYENNPKVKDNSTRLLYLLDNLQPNEFPIRLGHFSHCEAMTVDKYRNPKTRFDRKTNSNLPYGTTRTLAGGCFPMGWAKIAADAVS